MLKKNNKGFTLVELLVVIAIIGILAVVAVPALFKNIEKGKVADLESDISAIKSAVLSYYTDNSEYPFDDSNGSTEGGETIVLLQKNMSSIIPTDTSDKTKEATKAINSELEGLSFPYEGTYKLTDKTGNAIATSPETLYLTITTKGLSTTISEDGLKKLAQDLALDKGANANETTMAVTAASQGTGQKIIIPLINK